MLTGLIIACASAWVAIVVLAVRVEHANALAVRSARATLAQVEADRLERAMTNTVRLRTVADHPANAHRRRQYRDAR